TPPLHDALPISSPMPGTRAKPVSPSANARVRSSVDSSDSRGNAFTVDTFAQRIPSLVRGSHTNTAPEGNAYTDSSANSPGKLSRYGLPGLILPFSVTVDRKS